MTKRRQTVISVPKWLYDRLSDYYHKHQEELTKWGVKSINGLAVEWLKMILLIKENRYHPVREAIEAFPPCTTTAERSITERSTASEKSL